jgi:hypothetical protein
MRIYLVRPRPDERPRRRGFSEPRLQEARRAAWLEATRPRINL